MLISICMTLHPNLLAPDAPPSDCAAIGFNVETVTYNNIKFQVWDLGGQTSIRPYWRCYYPNTQARLLGSIPSPTFLILISLGPFQM